MTYGRTWRRLARLALVPLGLAAPWAAQAQLLEDPTIPAERSSGQRFEVPNPSSGHPGIEAILNFEFDRALAIFDELAARDPRHPEPALGRGLAEWWRLVSGSPGADPDLVEKHLERARDLSRDYGDRPGKRAEALYISGRASSLLSALHLIKNSMMSAYRASQQSKSYLSKCLEEDSTYFDANLGLGIYHYYADALPEYLKLIGWMFGLKGDRDLGLKELRVAATRGKDTGPEALYFLANVYSNFEGTPARGLDAVRWLVQKYPRNHVFFLEYMSALESLGYYGEAELLMRAALAENGRFEDVRAVRLMLGRNYYRQARYEEGARVLEAVFTDPSLSKKDPVVPWFSYFAGRCRDLMGEREAAEVHYRRAETFKIGGNVSSMAEDRRKNTESEDERRLRRARGLTWRGALDGAIHAWRSIVRDLAAGDFETEISLGQLRYRLALTLEEAGRYDEAKAEYARVDDEDFVHRAELGSARCDLRAGRRDLAERRLAEIAASGSKAAGKARELARHIGGVACPEPAAAAADSSVRLHYRESEAWRVEVVIRTGDGTRSCVPMTFDEGMWLAEVPVEAKRRGYYYRVDGSREQPDPLSQWVTEEDGAVWSIAMGPDPFALRAERTGLFMH